MSKKLWDNECDMIIIFVTAEQAYVGFELS